MGDADIEEYETEDAAGATPDEDEEYIESGFSDAGPDDDVDKIMVEGEKFVLAYKDDGVREPQFFRVKKSEIGRDPSLTMFDSKTIPLKFDPAELISDKRLEPSVVADSYVLDKIKHKLMVQNVRRQIEVEKLSLENIADIGSDIKSMDDPIAHIILTLVTDKLKSENLWRDEDKDLTMTEAFPLSQAKLDPRFFDLNIEEIEYGTFLEEDDLALSDEEVPVAKSDLRSVPFLYPEMATQMLHNIMRVSPDDLYHQTARRMVDSRYFDDVPSNIPLFRAAYLCSKGVESEIHFDNLMANGLSRVFDHYSFTEFRSDRVQVRALLRGFIETFFAGNDSVKRALRSCDEPEKREPKNIWSRFSTVWVKLSIKQKNALEKVYMQAEPMTYKAAAKDFKISVNSLVSRIRTAVLRFRHEFSEFVGITPKKIARRALVSNYAHSHLWRADSARVVHQLFKIDLEKGYRVMIDRKFLPKSKNLDWKSISEIKAKIIEKCPIPYIHEIEYFDGIMPTIVSFDRKPGNLNEDPNLQANRETGFRHFE
jgi:hypothetical protein